MTLRTKSEALTRTIPESRPRISGTRGAAHGPGRRAGCGPAPLSRTGIEVGKSWIQ